jgi:hypothetical protein
MLGARPALSRPEARIAWDYARLEADRYLARRLRDLDDQQLADLDARQQAILDQAPAFDPAELKRARQQLEETGQQAASTTQAQAVVQRLERAAQTHRDWRRAANDALDIRRQVALEYQRRQREHSIRPPALRLVR